VAHVQAQAAVVAATRRLKGGRWAAGAGALLGLTELAASVVDSAIARSVVASRLLNVTITSVYGRKRFGSPWST
jgi:hypothetical protein